MKSFFIVVVLMLRNGGAQTRIGGAPRAKESGRYMNPEEQNQLKALLMDVSRIRADLIAKNRYKDACQIVSEYNAISDAFHAAVANSPEGSDPVQLSDFVGNTLSKYGL